jgi:hypothetical protein
MGQVHPSGQNVVGFRQLGGGKDCDCGAPTFDRSNAADPRFAAAGITREDFDQRLDQATAAVQRHRLKPYQIAVFIIAIIAISHIGSVPGLGMCPLSGQRRRLGGGGSDVYCKGRQREADGKLVWPNLPGDTRTCSDAEQHCDQTLDAQCREHVWHACCAGESPERKRKFCDVGIIFVVVIPVMMVGLMFAWIMMTNKKKLKALHEIYADWEAKGTQIVYIRPAKHSYGYLYFVLPPSSAAPIATAGAGAGAITLWLLAVTVPAGVGPGQLITVQGPSGQQVSAEVPAGVTAGMSFHVQVPAAQPGVVVGTVVQSANPRYAT